jgi:cytochrome c oxidase subunit IV
MSETNGPSHGEHIVPLKVYFTVFGVLMVLTATTVAVAYVDLGPLNLVAALGIAICKATLVILYFMHVKYSGHMVKVYVTAGFLFLVIMLGVTLSDYMTRGWISSPRGWQ